MEDTTDNILNGLATQWERLAENQRNREVELIGKGDDVLATSVGWSASIYENCAKELRDDMRTIRNHKSHLEMCKNLIESKYLPK